MALISSATSGSPDLIRIKIWDKAKGNAVVYDSQLGRACPGDYDHYDPCTPVVGGDVKIHK